MSQSRFTGVGLLYGHFDFLDFTFVLVNHGHTRMEAINFDGRLSHYLKGFEVVLTVHLSGLPNGVRAHVLEFGDLQ